MSILYRATNRNDWRARWPWRWLFPPRINERFCRECGLPYQDGPRPKQVGHFQDDCVSALVFPAGSYRRGDLAVRFGRWVKSHGEPHLSELIPLAELDSLLTVIQHIQDEYQTSTDARRARR